MVSVFYVSMNVHLHILHCEQYIVLCMIMLRVKKWSSPSSFIFHLVPLSSTYFLNLLVHLFVAHLIIFDLFLPAVTVIMASCHHVF